MTTHPSKIFTGIGYLIDPDTGNEIEHFGQVKLTQTIDSKEFPSSASYSDITLLSGSKWAGSITFKGITGDLLAQFLGGTKSTSVATDVDNGSDTVDATAYTVTLSNAPVTGTFRTWKLVSGERVYLEVSISGTTVTYDAAEAGNTVYYTFQYETSEASTKITFDPDSDLPSTFALRGVFDIVTAQGTNKKADFYIKRAKRTGDLSPFSIAVQDTTDLTINFNVEIQNDGDLVLNIQQ